MIFRRKKLTIYAESTAGNVSFLTASEVRSASDAAQTVTFFDLSKFCALNSGIVVDLQKQEKFHTVRNCGVS